MSDYKGFVVHNSPEIRERIKKLWKKNRLDKDGFVWSNEQIDRFTYPFLRVGPIDGYSSEGLGQLYTAYQDQPTLRPADVTDEMILAALGQPIPEKAAPVKRPFKWVCRNTDGTFLKIGFNNVQPSHVDKIEDATLFDRRDEARGHWGTAVKVYIAGFSLT